MGPTKIQTKSIRTDSDINFKFKTLEEANKEMLKPFNEVQNILDIAVREKILKNFTTPEEMNKGFIHTIIQGLKLMNVEIQSFFIEDKHYIIVTGSEIDIEEELSLNVIHILQYDARDLKIDYLHKAELNNMKQLLQLVHSQIWI